LRDIIKLTTLTSWSKIYQRENSIGLYGYDVLIDADIKMWLLEVNLCPTMEHSTKVTAKLVPQMTDDLLKVIIDVKAA
jgi:D-alanine-D-alanine ligase-like ATP-grasp enzyme